MSALTLTRDEASAIAHELTWTADAAFIADDLRERNLETTSPAGAAAAVEDLQDAIERLRLESTIRNSGGWWGLDSPNWLDLQARYGEDPRYGEDLACPDTFKLDHEGAAALRTFSEGYLPLALAEVVDELATASDLDRSDCERRRAALVSLAARFGIAIVQEATA